ncbi:MAG: RluA family pseudouridine synthase [Candidatus Staskawiczbacteria bacterium]|nr:RluA family pseudouridine synthase [Candidatus Staskawiczbacteria bacterium]
MDIKIIYEDNDVLVVDKPAGVVVFPEGDITREKTLIDYLVEKYPELGGLGDPPRFGIVHRLDKDTSGILLVAKSRDSLIFFQKQFKNREVEKKYIALVIGEIKDDKGLIETLIGRAPGDKRKQKVYLAGEPGSENKREAITEYKVLQGYGDYTLLEVKIKTGRRHQIRCHLSYIHHPIAGDKMYGFKDSPVCKGLTRQFLHAAYLKIKLPGGETKEFRSELPEELNNVLKNLKN